MIAFIGPTNLLNASRIVSRCIQLFNGKAWFQPGIKSSTVQAELTFLRSQPRKYFIPFLSQKLRAAQWCPHSILKTTLWGRLGLKGRWSLAEEHPVNFEAQQGFELRSPWSELQTPTNTLYALLKYTSKHTHIQSFSQSSFLKCFLFSSDQVRELFYRNVMWRETSFLYVLNITRRGLIPRNLQWYLFRKLFIALAFIPKETNTWLMLSIKFNCWHPTYVQQVSIVVL